MIGTPRYRRKYDNDEPMGGYVAAAEGDLIGERMTGSEARQGDGAARAARRDEADVAPALLAPRVHADFRDPARYFAEALRLVLSLYAIPPRSPIALELDRLMRKDAPLAAALRRAYQLWPTNTGSGTSATPNASCTVVGDLAGERDELGSVVPAPRLVSASVCFEEIAMPSGSP